MSSDLRCFLNKILEYLENIYVFSKRQKELYEPAGNLVKVNEQRFKTFLHKSA
jgi:hypothetical protein